ncbi:double-strand break repair helicase AddA [Aurantiacibacter sp. D1-12]|uniref:double-strand break repair helicase AddA n=1 Tax=Aurantiacibacter sp. D1-12 TaxID=2993658 RepID=UPI00237D2B43|nr:double-strand break repair helicase AddA [Aurantiacibacter sp. D1-12]MDE1466538.1 double-strand break repair helicase AddA [Aurantiacibacter sp. D1-12]
MSGKVFELKDNQRKAVAPDDSVWLSASAGTGKTQVLSARVLRLLLTDGVRPENILCLTFTKAGAAEMAERVNEVLANWVRMPGEALAKQLGFIGADMDQDTVARARSLFASVLDCPGGGLRINTIHAFSQWLLSAFPNEAELIPGTKAMEDRDRDLLADRVLRELLVEWQDSDPAAVAALEELSVRLGPDRARGWLMRCAGAHKAWFGKGAWQPPMEGRVRQLLGVAPDADAAMLCKACADGTPLLEAVRQVMWAYDEWGAGSGQKFAAQIGDWLLGSPEERFGSAADLLGQLYNDKGLLKYQSNLEKKVDGAAAIAENARAQLQSVAEQATLLELAAVLTPALEVGYKFAIAWAEVKKREGFVDFDDLIAKAAELLKDKDQSDWIRYKLDREFDHILVDEAQDTNQQQWDIVDALADDFFSGLGQRGDRQRTVFVVGDYKQAIFGFQGTSPQNFAQAQRRYAELLHARREQAEKARANITARDLQDLDLDRSYRTSQPVLDFVDSVIEAIGYDNIGLKKKPERHEGDDRAGLVTLWKPVPAEEEDEGEGGDDGAEHRVSPSERRMADKIAEQVKLWLDKGFALEKGERRNAKPGDIMILVRKRGELVNPIVARLHAAGVPVAGVDRLRLGAPLAVQDLMAALRFAAQPHDDLSLAALLVSPIFGWSQEQLLEHGYRPAKTPLWEHLRKSTHADVMAATDMLKGLLAIADYEPPQAMLHWMLVGPWQARGKLVARLGQEANDPIDELLGAALQFSAAHTPSLQGFIRWFDVGDGELKREAEGSGGLVRVMTVHGSKGLQAPIVILADACSDPDASRASALDLEEEVLGERTGRDIPILPLSKSNKVGPISEAEEKAAAEEREEHWRLLYVAMTRAEEALFIGGALNKRSKKGPKPDSWYARVEPLFGDEWVEDSIWGARAELGVAAKPVLSAEQGARKARVEIPTWASTSIGPEPRPPRPLAPSSAADELGADPPLPAAQAAVAGRRGVLIHSLLERLPDTPSEMREAGGRAWLERHGPDLSTEEREEMLSRAIAVLDAPEWRELFGPDALAEVPLAAVVGDQVIAGTADRLLVTETRVLVADFKTARRPPRSLEDIPRTTLVQMASYVSALEVIYPGRTIEAAVLYTQVPQLIAIPADVLASNRPGLKDEPGGG